VVWKLSQSVGQKHHYIPKFYLKQWVGEDGKLCEFTRPNNCVKPRRVAPDGTGYVRGLNTFALLPPQLANFLEDRFFRIVDSQAARVLKILLQDNVDLDADAKSDWSRFLMSLLHRNPEGMARIGKKVADEFPTLLETAVRSQYEASRSETDPETFEEFRATFSQKEIDEVHLHVLHRIMDSENVGSLLNSMQWAVIHFDSGHHRLMTSDSPIWMTPGLGRPEAVLGLAISPRQIFVAAHDRGVLRCIHELAVAGGLAQRLNNCIARQARKYVFSVDDTPLPFVAERLGDKMQWCPWE
jgi:uncharacterized protein DUF4238